MHFQPAPSPQVSVFPVVVLAGGAGNVHLLLRLVSLLDTNDGMGILIVVPSEPATHNELIELLQQSSPLSVVSISQGMPLEPNRVHVCPPDVDVFLSQGAFLVQPSCLPKGMRTPIDHLLATVAANCDEYVCVCFLHGEDTRDGPRGLTDVSRRGGVCFVLEPDISPLSALPRLLLAGGWADGTFDVHSFANVLATHRDRLLGHTPPWRDFSHRLPSGAFDKAAARIVGAVSSESGIDFRRYRQAPLHKHMETRALAHGLTSLTEYCDVVEEHSEEALLLSRLFLDNHTSFLRDPASFDNLGTHVLAPMLEERARQASTEGKQPTPVRIWVAACSTGEEAYSIALVCSRLLQARGIQVPIEILATDVSQSALTQASRGEFDVATLANLSPLELTDFFSLDHHNRFKARPLPGFTLDFLEHNLLSSPPITEVDLVCLRNVLIYFEDDTQAQILRHVSQALRPGGTLFVARVESSSSLLQNDFRRLDRGSTLFEKVTPLWNRAASKQNERSLALQRPHTHAPSVVVAEDLLVVECDDEAFEFFRTSPDAAHCDFLPLVHASTRAEWAHALRRALDTMTPVQLPAFHTHGPFSAAGASNSLGHITPFLDEQGGRRLKITFEKESL